MEQKHEEASTDFDLVHRVKDFLKEVNAIQDVAGSMVFTEDGFLVASVISSEILEETVAAVASRFIISTRNLVESLNFGKPSRFTLRAKQGVFALIPAGHAYLAVVGNASFDAKAAHDILTNAARQIRDLFKLPPSTPPEKSVG